MRDIDIERIKKLGLKPEDFEPKEPVNYEEQISDLTDLVTVLVEVISND